MVMALRARMAELQTIYEIGQEISAGVELEETLRYILASIRGVIPYEMAELGFFDQAKNRMIIRAAADINATEEKDVVSYYEPETARFYDVNEGILARLVKEGSALLIANMTEDADLEFGAERKWGGSGAKSYLGVVLKTKNKVVGSIELVSSEPYKFDQDNCRLLTSIAAQAAIEVQNAQELQEREQRLARQIQQMDIVIDKDKQKQQINDIIETKFFQVVQKKAKEVRKSEKK
jgi:GAF domain-containing protein